MVNSIALLSTAQSPYSFHERGDVAMMLFNKEIAKVNYCRSERHFDAQSHQSNNMHRKKQNTGSATATFIRKENVMNPACLKTCSDPSNMADSSHGLTDGLDSHEGIGKVDVSEDGQTLLMSKIPFHEGSRRMWNLVASLRGDANWPKGSRLASDHKISSPLKANLGNSSKQFIENPPPTSDKTMIAQRLPKEYLPTRRIDMPSEEARPSRRVRSRAIAIKRPSTNEQLDEIRQSTVAAEYDWATWRMYNRIIDHRQRYPLNYHPNDSMSREDQSSTSAAGHGTKESTFPQEFENLPVSSEPTYPEYGEVFELDL
jgi:hypothetical protein